MVNYMKSVPKEEAEEVVRTAKGLLRKHKRK